MLDLSADHDEVAAMVDRIQVLSRVLWEGLGSIPDVERWLRNFDGTATEYSVEIEQLNALHLLSHFSYFGLQEVRELLKSMYRDLFRYPLIQDIREAEGGSRDYELLQRRFEERRDRTRFLGVGNPSESGAHLLYYFRQVNGLSRDLFINRDEILTAAAGDTNARIAIDGLERLVFIDDVLGSGLQATEYSEKLLGYVREAAARDNRNIEIVYLMLFAKEEGLGAARSLNFDRVDAVHELNASELAFDAASHVYSSPPERIALSAGLAIASSYGIQIAPGNGLGFGSGQLMLGLHHNVPDNTLPIFWFDESVVPWEPIFRRYRKLT